MLDKRKGRVRDKAGIESGSRRENWATEVAKSDNGEVMVVAATIRALRYITNDGANDPLSHRRSLPESFPCARVSSARISLPETVTIGKRLPARSSRSSEEFSHPNARATPMRWMELVCRRNHAEVVNIVATKLIKKFRAKYMRWA